MLTSDMSLNHNFLIRQSSTTYGASFELDALPARTSDTTETTVRNVILCVERLSACILSLNVSLNMASCSPDLNCIELSWIWLSRMASLGAGLVPNDYPTIALNSKKLIKHYQTSFNMATNTVTGFTAHIIQKYSECYLRASVNDWKAYGPEHGVAHSTHGFKLRSVHNPFQFTKCFAVTCLSGLFAVLVLLTRNVIKLRKVLENDYLVPSTLIDSATTATSFIVFLPLGVDWLPCWRSSWCFVRSCRDLSNISVVMGCSTSV